MYWRRNLPHWVPEEVPLFVTWKLAGTWPGCTDGDRWLSDPRIAAVVAEAFRYGAEVRSSYDLLAWVIMPDHVHILIQPKVPLIEIMRWLKAATANRANRILGRVGAQFWQREYWDRWIRTEAQLDAAVAYIENNPVRKGLVSAPEDWRWSSAFEPAAETAGGPKETTNDGPTVIET